MLTLIIQLGLGLFFASLFLYKLIDVQCIKKFFLDSPNENRKLHNIPIPRSGGIIFAGLTLLTLSVVPVFEPIRALTIGGWGFFVIGLIDDVHRLSWKVKAPAQLGVAIWLINTQLQNIQVVEVFGLNISNHNSFVWFIIYYLVFRYFKCG